MNPIQILQGVFFESLDLFLKMAPYLLFGFFVAGILHVLISLDSIAKHLGKNNVWSVIKAVILGIPLPLCSCGVIPAAILLKKKGASKASVVSFLIATPITGVDSIFATLSLLGPAFTIYRVVVSSITAFIAGFITMLLPHHEITTPSQSVKHCNHCDDSLSGSFHVCGGKLKEMFYYAFVDLLGDIWKWLIIGVVVGGAISHFIPETLIQRYLGSGWQAMLIMLAVGIPMYVCATGSIPIAASLMFKGMSPGAALVFLLAGPATNAVTITVMTRELGKAATFIYVATIAVMSVVFGWLLNLLWADFGGKMPNMFHSMTMLPHWVELLSAIALAALILYVAVKGSKSKCRH